MNYADIRRLVRLVETSNIGEIEIEEGGSKLRIAKSAPFGQTAPQMIPFAYPQPGGTTAPVAPIPQAQANSEVSAPPLSTPAKKLHEVQSPMVGTFYRAQAPEAPPYVQIGDMVRAGQVLCIIEAMKLMNEIEADVSGRIVEIGVENAQPVEFGHVLFRIDAA